VATGSAATASANASPCSTPEISPCTTPIIGSPQRFPPQLYPDAYPFGRLQPSLDFGVGSSNVGTAMPAPSTSPPSIPSYTQGAIDSLLAAANLLDNAGTGGATPASSVSPAVTPRARSFGQVSDLSNDAASPSPRRGMEPTLVTMGFNSEMGSSSNVGGGVPMDSVSMMGQCLGCWAVGSLFYGLESVGGPLRHHAGVCTPLW
jgi:hypothetical protein